MSAQEDLINNLKWPIEDVLILLSRLEAIIPEDDKMSFKSREKKLLWDKVAFGSYSDEDCYNAWKMVRQQVRSFRLLSEMVHDARILNQKILTKDEPKKIYEVKPKNPINVYSAFIVEFSKKHPEIQPNLRFKMAAEAYQKLSAEEKQRYYDIAEKDKQRYNQEVTDYRMKYPEISIGAQELKQKKKRLNAFNVFFEAMKKNVNIPEPVDGKKTSMRNHLMKLWREMSDSEKLPWLEKAYKLQEEMEKASDNLPGNFKFAKNKDLISKKYREVRDRALGKPPAPPMSAYELFMKKVFKSEEAQQVPNKERLKFVSEKWKSISGKKKLHYVNKLKRKQEEYKEKYAEFLNSLDPSQRENFSAEPRTKFLTEPKMKKKRSKSVSDPGTSKDMGENLNEESTLLRKKRSKSVSEPATIKDMGEIFNEDSTSLRKKKKKKKRNLDEEQWEENTEDLIAEPEEQIYIKKKKKKKHHALDEQYT